MHGRALREHLFLRRALWAYCLCAVSSSASAGFEATFTPLGYLPGGPFSESAALGVSDNGRVVVGFSSSANVANVNDFEAFRWTPNTGMVGLGSLAGSPFYSRATAVSGNGQVIVGMSVGPSGEEAFRWTSQTGMVGLGDLPGLGFNSWATGVSRNGSVVVGYSLGALDFRAFRWTEQGGMVDLGDLPGGIPFSAAQAVSSDGNTVVGFSYTGAGKEAFRWTADSGMSSLGDLAGGAVESYARAISDNGDVIVGMSASSIGYEAFRWTDETGMLSIGSCGGRITSAFSTSRDGSSIYGSCIDALGEEHAWVWDESNGMRDLTQVLINDFALGSSLLGWELGGARVSADGKTLAGYGIYEGRRQAWVIDFRGNVPEPGSLLLLVTGLIGSLIVIPSRRLDRALQRVIGFGQLADDLVDAIANFLVALGRTIAVLKQTAKVTSINTARRKGTA